MNYIKIEKWKIKDLFDLINKAQISSNIDRKFKTYTPDSYIEIKEYKVNLTSQRYQVFKKSTICKMCWLKWTHFWLEADVPCFQNKKAHFNLYWINNKWEEILFTKDHIIPKSKWGKDILENYQTLCTKCNWLKKDFLL